MIYGSWRSLAHGVIGAPHGALGALNADSDGEESSALGEAIFGATLAYVASVIDDSVITREQTDEGENGDRGEDMRDGERGAAFDASVGFAD